MSACFFRVASPRIYCGLCLRYSLKPIVVLLVRAWRSQMSQHLYQILVSHQPGTAEGGPVGVTAHLTGRLPKVYPLILCEVSLGRPLEYSRSRVNVVFCQCKDTAEQGAWTSKTCRRSGIFCFLLQCRQPNVSSLTLRAFCICIVEGRKSGAPGPYGTHHSPLRGFLGSLPRGNELQSSNRLWRHQANLLSLLDLMDMEIPC